MNISEVVESVKIAKAEKMYWADVSTYGTEAHALRALDCQNREEAIKMLSVVQPIVVFKREGKVIVQ